MNKDFLIKQGWNVKTEYPLFTSFIHSRHDRLFCSIGKYGQFRITEMHWCNDEPERYFNTINSSLNEDDYFKILNLLNIKI
jgi:hypothetical protein